MTGESPSTSWKYSGTNVKTCNGENSDDGTDAAKKRTEYMTVPKTKNVSEVTVTLRTRNSRRLTMGACS